MEQLVDPEGRFEFKGVVPGGYFLVARTAERASFLSLDVGNVDLLNISVALDRIFEIPARVRIEGHPPGDDPELETLYFVIHRDSPIAGLEPQTYSPFSNGRFTLNVLPGDYRIHLSRPADFYIQSMTLRGANIMSQSLRVEESSETPLEIVVGSNPGSIEGRAQASSVTVVLIPNSERRGQRDLYKAVKAGASGEFRFAKVPPGDYKLFAWRTENGGPWRDPAYIGRYEERGVPVRIGKGENVQVPQTLPVLDQ
jgi:hypothetical protein